ncbi:MAG: glycosyltransferase family 4 protein [Spirochaetia bacterium]|nr:glycosyltransferase family 4 protein [Spirochaetia bacterium]
MKKKGTSQKIETHICIIGSEDVDARIPFIELLEKKNCRFTVLGTSDGESFRNKNIPFIRYKLNREFSPFKDAATVLQLRRIFKNHDFEIIQTFDTKPSFLAPLSLLFMRKKPRLYRTITGMGRIFSLNSIFYAFQRYLYGLIQRILKKRVDMTIFQNNDDEKYFIQKKWVEKNRYSLIKSSGIDLKNYTQNSSVKEKKQFRKKLNIPEKDIVIIMIGRLVKEKGVDYFIEAARQFHLSRNKATFLLVGPTESKNKNSYSENKLLSHSSYMKYLGKRNDIKQLLSIADIFVLPTYYREGVPRVLLEASAMGLPIVATDIAGCNDVVSNGVNGFLVPVKDTVKLIEKLNELYSSAELRKKFGNNNKKIIQVFNLDLISKQYLDLYKMK